MTREEAIENITEIKKCEAGVYAEALELAITSLSQEQQSEWERDHEVLKAYSDGQESMKGYKDAISRQAALDCLTASKLKLFDFILQAREEIMMLPSVSTEKTGRWLNDELIPNDISGHVHAECSVCHKVRIVDNYCPNCGAKMEVEE